MTPLRNDKDIKYRVFTMRMEIDLYENLKKSAIKNKRSIARELAFAAERYLNSTLTIE